MCLGPASTGLGGHCSLQAWREEGVRLCGHMLLFLFPFYNPLNTEKPFLGTAVRGHPQDPLRSHIPGLCSRQREVGGCPPSHCSWDPLPCGEPSGQQPVWPWGTVRLDLVPQPWPSSPQMLPARRVGGSTLSSTLCLQGVWQRPSPNGGAAVPELRVGTLGGPAPSM